MPGAEKRGFNLVELIITVLVAGVLATLAIPGFSKMKENAFDQEAIANLKLISAAQNIYRMEISNFTSCNNINEVNSRLKLSIPVPSPLVWDYKVDNITATTFRGKSRRNATGNRTWCINQGETEPTAGCAW